ncbi:hypothetical protein VitviT2T_010884 [Vitis vinifera]|uniref:Pentatricopeptide repeat-containing protein, chloroplastic n=1 Tax=Vitis vinifera TaxID=29760 RepID=A0ABY9C947_VITVI|nr:hypothetical protein VitviT2T_010884 [Vitis vinifera]
MEVPPPTGIPTPNTEKIKRNLIRKGVYPTPKIIHTLRKKEIQKSIRKSKRLANQNQSPTEDEEVNEEAHFRTLKREYTKLSKALMVGKPWERPGFKEILNGSVEYGGERLKREHLRELSEILEKRGEVRWLLDDDVEVEQGSSGNERRGWSPARRRGGDADAIRFLVDRLTAADITIRDWKFSRVMKQSGLQFTERQLLRIVEELGARGHWKHALSVVEWVYTDKDKDNRRYKSRFVYTKLLAVLGKAKRPHEALDIFNLMRGDCHIYPDMAAYHSVAVTLGQAGLLKELLNIIECMRQKPPKRIKNMCRKNWNALLEPDVVIFNAVLNACVPTQQWKGVSWVFKQLRKCSLKPNGATYGLAMEVMLQSGKYDHVHRFFEKMRRSGEAPKALTYKVLVRAFWEEGKVNEAVEVVRDMERRGVVGIASVYYELACCLCNNGRWQDAIVEVEKLKKRPHSKPLEVTFTGMITSSMDGGHLDDCLSIFEHMKYHCSPNIGTINAMLKVYGRNDMFSKAKELFEETKRSTFASNTCMDDGSISLVPDLYTYSSMLEASASAHQWEFFEYVYKEMTLSGYQLDQSKHALLLGKASRAGKWHLLEHAFDTILEAGEIPHPSIFTEMICQATAQHNYERAVTLINAMAHAPFVVSEKQWTDLFVTDDRISRVNLEKLLDSLHNCDVAEEATVSNLYKSLQSLCGSGTSMDQSSVAFGDEAMIRTPLNGNSGELDDNKKVFFQKFSADARGSDLSPHENPPVKNSDVTFDIFSVNLTRSEEEDDDTDGEAISEAFNYACNGDEVASNEPNTLDGNSEGINKIELNMRAKEDDSHGSNLPSANEILETWKKSRERDGIFFPFQLGQK